MAMDGQVDHRKHRDRMRRQIMASGIEGMAEHNILEFLLFYCYAQKDTNDIAHRLVDRFGSLAGVLDASVDDLMAVPDVGMSTAVFLSSLTGVWRKYQSIKTHPGVILDSVEKMGEYFCSLFSGRSVETLCLLCLDMKCKVISDRVMASGSIDRVSFPLRAIVEAALSLRAASVVIGHNHPGGLALPTPDDFLATEALQNALYPLGVRLYDHIIVCEDDFTSLRESGWFAGRPEV